MQDLYHQPKYRACEVSFRIMRGADLPIVSIVALFLFNHICIEDPIRYPKKGTTMETIGIVASMGV